MGSLEKKKPDSASTAGIIKPMDHEEFRRQGHLVIDFIADYYKNVEKYPVRSQVEPGYLKKRMPDSAPHDPEPIEEILRDVQNDIVPGITHWQSPNYYAYFPSSGSIAGFLGEMLSTGFNIVNNNTITGIIHLWLEKNKNTKRKRKT
jgi:tyrosine decarboxylase